MGSLGHNGCVAVGGVAVVAYHQGVILIQAHSQTLWAHYLAIVQQEFLSRHGHPFSALWTLKFHEFKFLDNGQRYCFTVKNARKTKNVGVLLLHFKNNYYFCTR